MPAEEPSEITADAEAALAALYPRVLDAEREIDALSEKLAAAEESIAQLTEDRQTLQAVEAALSAHIAELGDQIRRKDEEIDALQNSRTMRAVAVPRRIYAAFRSRP